MGDHGMDLQSRPGFAAGRAGDFIIAGVSQADVTEIIDVVDGTTDSLADSTEAQQVAAELPAETLSFTYLDGSAILDALGERTMETLQAMMSPADQAAWQAHSGFALSAVEPGFRIDAVTIPEEGGTLGSAAIANDPAIAAAAERVPAGTFLYQAGMVPEDAFASAAYMLALAVNGEMAGEEWQGDGIQPTAKRRRDRGGDRHRVGNPRFRSPQRAVRPAGRRVHRVLVVSHIRHEWIWARRGGRGHDNRSGDAGRDRA